MAVSQSNNIQNNNENNLTKPLYGKVVLTLENCILPQEKLLTTPSQVDGLDRESELDLRYLGCEIIQTSGILLRLPQVAMATGQIIFQRFYYCKSFVRHPMEIVAMACITLASKIEESPRRIRDVINVLHHIKQVRAGKTIQPLILDHNYIAQKNHVIKAERRILKELGFCVHVKHPHKIIVTLLEILKAQNRKSLLQTSWNYMNDSLRSDVFLRYPPEHIACACIYLSARLLSIPLPSKPSWFLVFGVNEATIKEICNIILSLYARKKPDADHLEKLVEDLRKAHQEAKQKAKNISGNVSPVPLTSSFSPKTTNSNRAVSPKHVDNVRGKDSSAKADNNSSSPIARSLNHDYNHYHNSRKRSHSPSLSPKRKRRNASESSRSSSSSSHVGGRTPPRSYKEHRPRRRHTHKHKKSRSPSSSHRHHRKHSYKSSSYYKNNDKNSYYYNEKPRKSKKERSKDSSRHRKSSPHRQR